MVAPGIRGDNLTAEMRLKLLRPMFFLAVAVMVATGGGWSIQSADSGPTQLTTPNFAAPDQPARVGRLPEGRTGVPGLGTFSLLDLPRAATVADPLTQVARIRLRAQPLSGGRILSAEQSNRGPPEA